jgi:hypothetical protein
MTLRPMDSFVGVRGIAGPRYTVGPWCANTHCTYSASGGRAMADQAHHIWSRKQLGGVFSWVELPDGTVIGNLTGVCVGCHGDLTGPIGGHRAAIRLDVDDFRLWWCRTSGHNGTMDYEPLDPVEPQPPTRESLIASPATPESEPSCPTCGQPRQRRRSPTISHGESRRRRKSWTIQVPDDEEDGALVLDTLVDDLAPQFDIEHVDAKSRYFVVVPALVFAQQAGKRFAESILGKGA